MIGKGKAIAHTGVSIRYGWNQEKDAEIVLSNNLLGKLLERSPMSFKQFSN